MMHRRSMAAIASAVALLLAVWLGEASAQGSGATGAGPLVVQRGTVSVAGLSSAPSAVAVPTRPEAIAGLPWCCPAGPAAGVTVTGQAVLRGQGPSVRDAAIRAAIDDAKAQASSAADAAGITLGSIVAIQISAPGFPLPLEGAASGVAPSGGATSGAPTAVCMGKPGCPPPLPQPVFAQTFVTVTVTWAIG